VSGRFGHGVDRINALRCQSGSAHHIAGSPAEARALWSFAAWGCCSFSIVRGRRTGLNRWARCWPCNNHTGDRGGERNYDKGDVPRPSFYEFPHSCPLALVAQPRCLSRLSNNKTIGVQSARSLALERSTNPVDCSELRPGKRLADKISRVRPGDSITHYVKNGLIVPRVISDRASLPRASARRRIQPLGIVTRA
jgi:hypothetical protein